MKVFIRILLLLVVLCATTHSIHAANIVWTNTAGGNWSVAANWSPNQVPDASDTAIITTDGDYTVRLDVSATVGGLVLGTTSGSSTQTFLIDGQTFTLDGQSVVNSNGQFNLNGGLITFSGILTNYGTVVWSTGDLNGDHARIDNYGLWDAKADNTFLGGSSGGTTTFNNFSTFRKSGGSQDFFSGMNNNVIFNNSGTVDVQIGMVIIGHGPGGGAFNIASGTKLFFDGYTLAGNTSFTGTGLVTGNTLTGSNAVLNGTLTVSYLELSGTVTIASNCVVTLTNNQAPMIFSGILTNYGTVVWSTGDLNGDHARIDNYGLWDAKADNTFLGGSSGGTTTFNNFGTFRKSGGSQDSFSGMNNNVIFNNSGTVDVQIGGLTIGGSYTLAGGTLNFGINSSNNFGSIYLAGDAALTGTLSINLTNGYSPAADNAFTLVSYGSESGVFTALNLPHLAPGLMWQTDYGSTTFTLIVTSAPPTVLSAAAGTTQNGAFSLSWNAIVGETYQLQYTTNLAPANWLDLGDSVTATNSIMTASDIIGLNPQRFYRLIWLP